MTTDSSTPMTYRPALVTLTEGVRDLSMELQSGLEDEDRVLTWLQEVTIRTLGQMDTIVYEDVTRQFRGPQGVLLGALLTPKNRRGAMTGLDEDVARDVRERFLAHHVHPAHRNAFRELRTDAGEYVDDAGDGDAHEPTRQVSIAMRPELNELEEWQQRALSSLLGGFGSRSAVLDWGHDVLLATHGELDEDWVTRIYRERSTIEVLCGDSAEDERARRLFAATYLLPAFRSGVRVLSNRAKESPDVGKGPDTEPPDW